MAPFEDTSRGRSVFVAGHTAYGPLAEACANEIPSLTVSLICQATQGRLKVDAALPAIAPLHEPVIYLSGLPPMLDTLTPRLREREVLPERIRTDA